MSLRWDPTPVSAAALTTVAYSVACLQPMRGRPPNRQAYFGALFFVAACTSHKPDSLARSGHYSDQSSSTDPSFNQSAVGPNNAPDSDATLGGTPNAQTVSEDTTVDQPLMVPEGNAENSDPSSPSWADMPASLPGIRSASNDACSAIGTPAQQSPSNLVDSGASMLPTIDLVRFSTSNRELFNPASPFRIFSTRREYKLSDGSSWDSGVGVISFAGVEVTSVEHNDDTIWYLFSVPDVVAEVAELFGEDFAAHFRLDALQDLTITAEYGSTTAHARLPVLVARNYPLQASGKDFNHLSAQHCASIDLTFHLSLKDGAIFDEHLFEDSFKYRILTTIHFTAE